MCMRIDVCVCVCRYGPVCYLVVMMLLYLNARGMAAANLEHAAPSQIHVKKASPGSLVDAM